MTAPRPTTLAHVACALLPATGVAWIARTLRSAS